mgnify:FL=1
MAKIRVLVVDDHVLVRTGLTKILSAQADIEVVGEAESGHEALVLARNTPFDVMVLDISMPDLNGLQVAETLRREGCAGRIVFLSMYNKESFIFRALEAGALGYVSKSAPSDEILRAVRWAHQGRIYLSPDSSTHIVAEYLQGRKRRMATSRYEELTPREQEVFRMLVDGYTNKAIARALYISPKTVDKHRASIMRKLEVSTFPELVRYAVSIGLLEVNPEEAAH